MTTKVIREYWTIQARGNLLYAVPGIVIADNVVGYTARHDWIGCLADVVISEKGKTR